MKIGQGFVSESAALKKIMLQHPTESLGFFCPYCFCEVKKSQVAGAEVCWCDCYARAFDPERLRSLSLDIRQWASYIANSSNRPLADALNRGEGDRPLVNAIAQGNYDIWCPGCERNRKAFFIGVWMRKNNQQIVCTYGICKRCALKREKVATESEATAMIDAICDRLLGRYPFLKDLV